MDVGWELARSLILLIVGWGLGIFSRPLQERLFGPKLVIHCDDAPGKTDEAPQGIYMKFSVQNMSKRSVARNCRAYLVALHEVRSGSVMKEDLIPERTQLPWEGRDFNTRDIPYAASQYADIVRFDKEPEKAGWDFRARPSIAQIQKLRDHRGTFRFSIIVTADGAKPATKEINVDYNGNWKTARPYDAEPQRRRTLLGHT